MMKSTDRNHTAHIDRAEVILAIAVVGSIVLAASWDLIYRALLTIH